MRFAILADIHANWPALELVLEDLDDQAEVHQIYVLGDMIGYYPYPRECMEALMERGAECILGNHERYLLGRLPKAGMTPVVMEPIRIAREELTREQLDFIGGLKEQRKIRDHFLLVHGSPRHCDEYLIRERWEGGLEAMRAHYPDLRLCFFGHTHKALVISERKQLGRIHRSVTFDLDPDEVYLINPGSVGQPRDRSPLASYLIYDSTRNRVHFRRVDYPFEETQEAVAARGLAPKLADRLARGR